MAENFNVTKDEFSNLELQAGLNIENASFFYSFIENNHKISGNSPIYSEVISQVKNSDNNNFLSGLLTTSLNIFSLFIIIFELNFLKIISFQIASISIFFLYSLI